MNSNLFDNEISSGSCLKKNSVSHCFKSLFKASEKGKVISESKMVTLPTFSDAKTLIKQGYLSHLFIIFIQLILVRRR